MNRGRVMIPLRHSGGTRGWNTRGTCIPAFTEHSRSVTVTDSDGAMEGSPARQGWTGSEPTGGLREGCCAIAVAEADAGTSTGSLSDSAGGAPGPRHPAS